MNGQSNSNHEEAKVPMLYKGVSHDAKDNTHLGSSRSDELGKSSGECWETVGTEDCRVKCDDAKDHGIKEELTIQVMNN